MSRFLDTSVILGSPDPDEPQHASCDRLAAEGGHKIHFHVLAETSSILTGGRQGRRLGAAVPARLIEACVRPYVQTVSPSGLQLMSALAECESRGVRGGTGYDWLHLAAARRASAEALVTLDLRDFQSLSRPGDPRIESP